MYNLKYIFELHNLKIHFRFYNGIHSQITKSENTFQIMT